MTKSLNETAKTLVAEIETFDRDCDARDYTDTDEAWNLLNRIRDELRPYLTASQIKELAELKARHEAEIERQGAEAEAELDAQRTSLETA